MYVYILNYIQVIHIIFTYLHLYIIVTKSSVVAYLDFLESILVIYIIYILLKFI